MLVALRFRIGSRSELSAAFSGWRRRKDLGEWEIHILPGFLAAYDSATKVVEALHPGVEETDSKSL